MRMSSSLVAPSAVAPLAIALLCGLGGPAMSQTTPNSALPGVIVVAPKEVTRVHRPVREAAKSAGRRRAPAAEKPAQTATRTPPPAPGSVLAKLRELERTSSNCTDGCQTSFKYGNQPWNGCNTTSDFFSATCRNVRNFKTYAECTEHGLLTGWARNAPGGIAAACSQAESWPGRGFRSPNSSDRDVGNSRAALGITVRIWKKVS
jgi:hypothetical protein